jgi:capsular polysaccharide biosynthesis protein
VAAGLILGLFGPFLFELLNRRVRCRDDVERELGVPVLAELRYAQVGAPAFGGSLA